MTDCDMKRERLYQGWCYLAMAWGAASLLWSLTGHPIVGIVCGLAGAGCIVTALTVRPNRPWRFF